MYLQYVQSLLNFGIGFSKSHKLLMHKDTYKFDNHLFNSFFILIIGFYASHFPESAISNIQSLKKKNLFLKILKEA